MSRAVRMTVFSALGLFGLSWLAESAVAQSEVDGLVTPQRGTVKVRARSFNPFAITQSRRVFRSFGGRPSFAVSPFGAPADNDSQDGSSSSPAPVVVTPPSGGGGALAASSGRPWYRPPVRSPYRPPPRPPFN